MFMKIFSLLVALQLSTGHVENKNDTVGSTVDQYIQVEILTKMSSYIQAVWNATPSDQNIQFFPTSNTVGMNMIRMQNYYETGLSTFFNKEEYLEKPYALANTLDKLARSPNVELTLRNAIFYDPRYTNKQYLSDLQTYFHSEAYGMFFDSNNTQSIVNSLNKWFKKNLKNKLPKKSNFLAPGMTNFHAKALRYSGCWDIPKTADNFDILIRRQRRRRFVPMPKFFVVKLESTIGNETRIYIETFNAIERIGYVNNSELQYEAIRLPYTKGDFAMAIVLPYPNQSLELIAKFTDQEYIQLLEGVNENYENVNYSVPLMDLSMVSVNENGTSINGNEDDLSNCVWDSGQVNNTNEKDESYKQFHVNRPYGVFLYHEQTKYVFWQALVRDPSTSVQVQHQFLNHMNALGEITERRHITFKT